MSISRLWLSVDKTTRKIAEEANLRADQAGIPNDEEKRQFYFQYIDKEICKMKDDKGDPIGQSRFKTLLKERAILFYTPPQSSLAEPKEVVLDSAEPKVSKKRKKTKTPDASLE